MSLIQFLVDHEVIRPDQATAAAKHRQTAGGSLSDALVSLGIIQPELLKELMGSPPPVPDPAR